MLLHLGSFMISAVALFGSVFAPAETVAQSYDRSDEIYYYETIYDNEDVPMPTAADAFNIYYTTKENPSYHYLAARCPEYTYAPAVGCCASIAAGNLIGYYDRFDENLIPDHKSGTAIRETYLYTIQDAGVKAVIDKLYEYITGDGYGATEEQFKDGVTRFCNEKGKNISFTSCMRNGSFSYETAKSYLDANIPVVMFSSGYNVCTIYSYDHEDEVDYVYSSANHIMVGFGYDEYVYTTSNGTEKYEYISVSSGLDSKPSGLYNINMQTKINNVLAINIY